MSMKVWFVHLSHPDGRGFAFDMANEEEVNGNTPVARQKGERVVLYQRQGDILCDVRKGEQTPTRMVGDRHDRT